jgi:fructose/tagatose bisphosphate aldolase
MNNRFKTDISQKFFIGPMSKEIVDCILEKDSNVFAIIPSRRQVDYKSGYVNNWNTVTFANYVKEKNSKFVICRDHSGAMQGSCPDDGYESLKIDSSNFSMIHIDPFKSTKNIDNAIELTVSYIKYCDSINKNLYYEISTEESIFYFDEDTLRHFIDSIYKNLGLLFDKISHIVIQSGTKLTGNNQVGIYSSERLLNQISIVKKFDKYTKEHNGDYIDVKLIKEKFDLGLDSINIAPEFGYLQTCSILDCIDDEKFQIFYQLCLDSGKWKNWVSSDFDPTKNKLELVKICGHYVYSNETFINQISSQIDKSFIYRKINKKLGELSDIV